MILDTKELKIRKGVIPGKTASKKIKSDPEKYMSNVEDNRRVLILAQKYWEDLADWRARNFRAFMYYRGKQWHEMVTITDRNGKTVQMTEEEYIKSQGKIPFKQNIIRQLIKNILGQYRSNPTDSIAIARSKDNAAKSEMLTTALQAALEINNAVHKDARNLEAMCLSGAPIAKVGYKYIPTKNRDDVKITNIQADRFFFNGGIKDVDDDIRFLGEIIDAPIEDIIAAFAKTNAEATAIRDLYKNNNIYPGTGRSLTQEDIAVNDFMIPNDLSLCRLYEIWEYKLEERLHVHDYYDGTIQVLKVDKSVIDNINAERIAYYASNGVPEDQVPLMVATPKMEQFWYVKYLTPHGACLFEGETPYEHEEHPYAFTLYPLVNGEVWSLTEDIIDQQRYINRLIAMLDFIMGASAKGVLLVPEDAIPDDSNIEEFAEEWTKFNGVIKFKPNKSATIPQQVASNSSNIGAHEMLTLQMQLVMQISGVNNAAQGMKASSGTPSSLYAQEAQNSMLNTRDMLDTFAHFKQKRDYKVLSLIRQYYDDRMLTIAGKIYNKEAAYYKASEAKAMKDVDISIVQGSDTPVFRSIMDDTLWKLLEAGLIDIEMYLNNSNMPFGERLLNDVKLRKEQAAKQQQGAMTPEQMQQMAAAQQQAAQQSDPKAIAMMQRMAQGEAA